MNLQITFAAFVVAIDVVGLSLTAPSLLDDILADARHLVRRALDTLRPKRRRP